jgi:hypothetical protein
VSKPMCERFISCCRAGVVFLSFGSHLIDWLPVRTCRSSPEAGLRTAEDSARSMDSIKHTVVKNQGI